MVIFSRYSWWVGAMVGLALLLAIAGQVGLLRPFQGIFLTATSPLERAFGSIFQPVASFLSDAGNLNELQDENRRLRLENESLQNAATENTQLEARIKELEAAAGVTSASTGQELLTASILARQFSAFTATISIDKGTNDGVRPGMVVLSVQGSLVGKVTESFANSSFVRLVTDGKSAVSAQILESGADGIVKGGANRTLTLQLAQADIVPNDTVVTSGLGGNFPPGIPIGKVSEVTGTNQDLFRTVKIEPQVRFSTASTVLVLTSFTPQRIAVDTDP
ncbi:hypothetical protein AYO38_08270 [bacterium SCGC AG-212-C10]|nr:hypothetical protein AYO38_08270 [bacterium SCGC AG-212-C10]